MTTAEVIHERVRCALCGADDARTRFTVAPGSGAHGDLWLGETRLRSASGETIVACRRCGLVYVNPRVAFAPGLAPYSTAAELAYFARTRAARARAYDRLLRTLPRWLGEPPRALLDVGCGDGLLLELARRRGVAAQGSELSDALARLVRGRLGGDAIVDTPLDELPAGRYDAVTLVNVLEHVHEPGAMLRTAARLLRPGGMLAVHVPNFGGLPARLRGASWHQIEPLSHLYYFTHRTLAALLRRHGLEPVARFSLVVSGGARGAAQRLLDRAGLYLDSGLGVAARKL
jgi:2-polyprenyl-3-methyl-5-hydroxy-6-metoxy-1,4-benzoquinol methylase